MAWHDAVQQWSVMEAYLMQVQELALIGVLGEEALSISMPNLDRHSFVYLDCFFLGANTTQMSLQRACTRMQTTLLQLIKGPSTMTSVTSFVCVLALMTELGMEAECSNNQKEPRALPLLGCTHCAYSKVLMADTEHRF